MNGCDLRLAYHCLKLKGEKGSSEHGSHCLLATQNSVRFVREVGNLQFDTLECIKVDKFFEEVVVAAKTMGEDAIVGLNSAFAPASSLILALTDNRFTWKTSFERCRMGSFCTSNNPAITRHTKQEDTVFHTCRTIPSTRSVLPHSRASLNTVHTPLKHR